MMLAAFVLIAATASTICSGVTLIPCPKAAVAYWASPIFAACRGTPASAEAGVIPPENAPLP